MGCDEHIDPLDIKKCIYNFGRKYLRLNTNNSGDLRVDERMIL
jgi:hypothetical protein